MTKSTPLSVERPMLIGFASTMLVLLLVGSITWNNASESATAARVVSRGHNLIDDLAQLRDKLDRAENRQGSYFLTHEPVFLTQRDQAAAQATAMMQKILVSAQDQRAEQERMTRLQLAVSQRLSMFTETQAAFDAQGFAAAQPQFNAGRIAAASVQEIIDEATRAEQGLLAQRKDSELLRLKIITLSVAALLVFLALLTLWIRHVTRRQLAADLTLQESQQPLLKAGALQDAIFNSANFSSIATDADGVIQIFNVGAETMLGYSADEVVNKITPAGISDPQEIIARAEALSLELDTPITPGFEALVFKASRGIEDIYEMTYIRKDGSRFPAIVSVTALRDADDRIIGYLLIGTDNTARKQVEAEQALLDQRLRDQQFYTRSLIESNIDALMTTDPRGIISDVNQQMEALTGCSRDELIGAPFKDYFTDPARAEAAIKRVLREGKVTNYELTAHARDGRETVVSYNATTFHDRDRKLQGVFAAARDVTERKQFELALQENNLELEGAKAAAEKANLAKSEFLSSMSHELRTPLNAVLGFAQLMASGAPPPTPAQQLSLDQILKGGWYLLRLINEILDLAMIESGKVTMSHESMSLADVLADCQAMIEPQAQKRGIQMVFTQLASPFYVHADRTRVKQVMINLLSNATKYNRIGGAVTVDCTMHGSGRVRVSVRDSGMGLTPEQVGQLFQPFNRLGQESSAEEGTGIGLVVTKQLVELMGGTIGVESTVGVGSVFWVELVGANAPELEFGEHGDSHVPDQNPLGPQQAPQRTILYVEDNPANLALIEQLIARRGDLKLLSATDGHQGIQLARAYQPDVILMDINLPGISGYGAMAILREDIETAHIPVMALSANAVPRDIEKGMEAGFFRYLTKPIKVPEFMEALDLALRHADQRGLDKTLEPVA
ncbi:PAS domain S-box-containing protein [Actimicrobium sp. GrIS 1.19]|uniref:PAS domain S-box protein n=1 Tax=Actimicrobium sp. GrIS 1.19 TaxID=3071708 RepID=UPI002E01F999|nr:PAS domain S-box-containing protein [Actimicrobium sp. GrIS 1.19]